MDIQPRFVKPSYKTFTLDPAKIKAWSLMETFKAWNLGYGYRLLSFLGGGFKNTFKMFHTCLGSPLLWEIKYAMTNSVQMD